MKQADQYGKNAFTPYNIPDQNPTTGVSGGSHGSKKGIPGVSSLNSGGNLGHKKFVPAQIGGSSIKGAGFNSKPYMGASNPGGADSSSGMGIYGSASGPSNSLSKKPSVPG